MAAKSKSSVEQAASLGKRFLNHILSTTAPLLPLSSPFLRRGLHASVYEKNVEEQVNPAMVPNEVIPPQTEEYWVPDPETGVFGPASEQNGENGYDSGPVNGSGAEGSVLEEKAFFRELEDLDLPPPHPFTAEAPSHPLTEELPSNPSKSEDPPHQL